MASSSSRVPVSHRQLFVEGAETHVVEAGHPNGEHTLLLLHGWPEDWSEFEALIALSSPEVHVVAMDLPGIGGSKTALPSGEKRLVARHVLGVIDELALRNVTVVGHDAGGMIAYACLREYPERLSSVVILSTVIPGVAPWNDVLRNPYIWHFAFHSVPSLPEHLVAGKQKEYFDFFYRAIAAHPERITEDARRRYVDAYSSPSALKAGFDWYRAFEADANANAGRRESVRTPLLYVRGAREMGKMEDYAEGLRDAGIVELTTAVVPDSGHFIPEEQPAELWRQLRSFVNSHGHG